MKILFVDDDAFISKAYVQALKGDFIVDYVKKAAPAIQMVNTDPTIAAIVLDIMLPIPLGVPKTTLKSFVNTGFYILKSIRPVLVARPLPVILLTNRKPTEVVNRVSKFNKELRKDTSRKFDQISFQHKPNCQSGDICAVVSAAINECR